MDGTDDPDRFEIEPIPNDEASIWGRHGTGPPPTTVVPGSGNPVIQPPMTAGRVNPKRRRVVGGAVAAGALALVAGWAVIRSGSESAGEIDVDATTTVVADSSVAPGSTPAPLDGDVVSTSRVTTTTEPRRWVLSSIEVDTGVAELGVEIVAVNGRDLLELDTRSGELRSFEMTGSYEQPVLEVGSDWILLRSPNTNQSRLFRGRDAPEDTEWGDLWMTFRQPDADRFWEQTWSDSGDLRWVYEVEPDGRRTGASHELGAHQWLTAVDPAGGLVVSAPGGTYHLGDDGSRRLSVGAVFALSATTAFVYECGEQLPSCGLFVVDRADGARRQVIPIDNNGDNGPREITGFDSASNYGFGRLSDLSPDGRYAPLIASATGDTFGMIDLVTGEFTQLAEFPESQLWWSPDSTAVMYIWRQRLMLHDLVDGTTTSVLPDDISVQAFAVRSV